MLCTFTPYQVIISLTDVSSFRKARKENEQTKKRAVVFFQIYLYLFIVASNNALDKNLYMCYAVIINFFSKRCFFHEFVG